MSMQEIRCPKCGEVFQVDESGYAAIVKQVRDKEFTKEIQSRENQFETDKNNAVQLAKLETEKIFTEKLNQKEAEIAGLKSEIETGEIEQKAAKIIRCYTFVESIYNKINLLEYNRQKHRQNMRCFI